MTKLSIAILCCTALAFAALATAQDTKETPKASPASKPGCCVQQVYQVKHGNAAALYQLLYTNAGQGQTPILRHNESLNVISVYGTPQEVNSIIANLKGLDIPSMKREGVAHKNSTIELTAWILAASAEEVGQAIPEVLAAPVAALRKNFGYRSFSVLGADIIRTVERQSFSTNGNASPPQPKLASRAVASYSMRADSITVEDGEAESSLRLNRFLFRMAAPYCTDPECRSTANSIVQLESTFRVKEGQQVVVGQSKLDGGDKALVLIVSAKVVD
ncbi:MAG: hypothetical protein IH602_20360 [Bryobacteraceae bacterium]|nr:hypothetical protein [Bryobacteraceae bacterium]